MRFEELVPSRELCEKMAELNICQNEPELWWLWARNTQCHGITTIKIVYQNELYKSTVAPTLSRMMEELPYRGRRGYQVGRNSSSLWYVQADNNEGFIVFDKNFPNAIAKALIAIKEGK